MKEAIINEAIPLFLQYGFKSVTVDDIALKMSVSKKTIYTHFPKKEQLVETSAMRHFNFVMDKILSIAKHSKDPIIELYLIKKEALNHLSNEKNSPVYQLQKYYKAIYKKLKAKEFEVLGSFFSESIKKGIETGLFRPEVDINFVTRIFFNGIRGIQDIELFPIDEFKIDQLLINFSEYHLRAICTPDGIQKLNNYKKELTL
ncbi:MAG: TetR/AcrR family transcriptional regulator [Flavobacteriaceae bacterium]|nr:TetR/AcrR family transcriptional regulator [Flavobacteriaceae bacterium]